MILLKTKGTKLRESDLFNGHYFRVLFFLFRPSLIALHIDPIKLE
jgi:hypothetical protein